MGEFKACRKCGRLWPRSQYPTMNSRCQACKNESEAAARRKRRMVKKGAGAVSPEAWKPIQLSEPEINKLYAGRRYDTRR